MLTTLLILANKIITFVCKLFGKEASVFPGSIVRIFDKNILKKIKMPKIIIGVTGSSGKGSTTQLLAHILKSTEKKVVYNTSGSNGLNAVITLVLNNTKLNHKMDCDILLLELDERYLKTIFKPGDITHLIVTNITRDQPARNYHPDIIYNEIFNNINDKTHLIINADDPIINKVKLFHKGKITTYGIGKTKASFFYPRLNAVDEAYCPKCNRKLSYNYYHYGHVGSYECKNKKCKYSRGKVDYEATNISLTKKTVVIENQEIQINKNILYAVYYTVAAYAACRSIGIKKEDILYALNENPSDSKTGKVYELDNRKINMLESKNENALSYYQTLKYIADQKGSKTIILGFDNVSRRYEHNDLSWLWDVEFELLKKCENNIDKFVCIGRFKYDVANRLAYAGIKEDKLIFVDDLNNLIKITRNETKGEIFTMVCFDMSMIIKNQLNKEVK